MKPAVLEVMRMNRVCRMVLVTSVGSFILVIFYFQSMLHPGRAPAPAPHRPRGGAAPGS
uniref:Carbohydrate sulfotransferase n=1 Tax=Otus sunia TaxID=257818 RepID=A0A8C8AKL4_9STRI